MTKRAGISLVEILMAVTLVGLVGLTVASLFGMSQGYLVQDTLISAMQGDAQYAMEHMQRHLMLADNVTLPAGNPGNQINFRWQPTLGAPIQNSSYRFNLGNLEYNDTGAAWEVIARNVNAVTFTGTNNTASPPQIFRTQINLVVQSARAAGGRTNTPLTVTVFVNHRGVPPS